MLRSNTVFVLSLCLFGEVIQYSALTMLNPPTIPGTTETIRGLLVVYIALGVIAFGYRFVNQPDYTALSQKPLGIALMMVQNAILGVGFVIEGLILLFLPVPGITGIVLAAIGIGFFKLAKGLSDGHAWALEVMLVLTVIGILGGVVVGIIVSQLGFGIPILSLFQLWYLRRSNVADFFNIDSLAKSSQQMQELARRVARFKGNETK